MKPTILIDMNLSPEWVTTYRPELEAGALVVVDEHKSRVRILPLG